MHQMWHEFGYIADPEMMAKTLEQTASDEPDEEGESTVVVVANPRDVRVAKR